jgi:hypothetical protein
MLVPATCLMILAMTAPAAGKYVLIKDVWSTAGGQVSSASYLLGYSLGQTITGLSQGEDHTEWAGFWGNTSWGQATLASQDRPAARPQRYLLHQNYPNPFNPETHIVYQVPEAGMVSLCIYNVRGQLVRRLEDRYQRSGEHAVTWDGRDGYGIAAASGVYFYSLTAGSFRATRKMLLLK